MKSSSIINTCLSLYFIATGFVINASAQQPVNSSGQQQEQKTSIKPKSNTNAVPMVEVDPAALLPISRHPNAVEGAIYADPTQNAAERTLDLLRRMTFEEKVDMTGGWNKFLTHSIDRLGIRSVSMADAGQGIRLGTAIIRTKSVSFPAMIALAATWNPSLAKDFGRGVGEECRALGVDILLGPGVNMQRLSMSGRNFEYFGEDPFLASIMAREYILGLQGQNVIAVPKCYLGYDQEFCRHIASSNMDERTMREIYLPIWESIVKGGGAMGMMTGNNLMNGIPSYMHRPLINGILRGEYGFRGMAMTDWQNSSYFPEMQEFVLTSGISLMMPVNATLKDYIDSQAALSPQRKAEIEILVEKMAFYTLYPLFAFGIFDRESNDPEYYNTFDSHKTLAREIAAESITLLRNEKNILPIPAGKKVLLIGPPEIQSGSGSGLVAGYDHISFEQGLRAVYGDNFVYNAQVEETQLKKADVVLFSLTKGGSEGHDIPFDGHDDQLEQLRKATKLNKNVVVLINAANGLPTDWLKDVRGVLWCYFLGQERGAALAGVISGKVAPSGKLPFTIERSPDDSPAPTFNYIGGKPYWKGNNEYRSYWLGMEPATKDDFSQFVKPGEVLPVPYNEGIFMGYRWYDKKNLPVAFPFGYGLSYTDFAYKKITVRNAMESEGIVYVDVELANTGKVDAKETVQVYVREVNATVERPQKELKAFAKVLLNAGKSHTVTLSLDDRSFSFWDVNTQGWKRNPGEFRIMAGGSSVDLPLTTTITFQK